MSQTRRPRLGFAGLGWIGRQRMESLARGGLAEIAAVADASSTARAAVTESLPDAVPALARFEDLLDLDLDGIVISTPSALHAAQAISALRRGFPVFCQKPLGRNADETRRVITCARAADRLLAVDLSYRHLSGVQKIRELIVRGDLGDVYACDLVFHNAYGPDKPWFYDRTLSGGGCVIDLGIHLVDLALWLLGFPKVQRVEARIFAGGKPLLPGSQEVEDYAEARLDLATGGTIRVACSWKLPAGRDAAIRGGFYGTRAGAEFFNVNGSFYEFAAEKCVGTRRQTLSAGTEDWSGGAIAAWARQLSCDRRFDPEIETLQDVASALDGLYRSAGATAEPSLAARPGPKPGPEPVLQVSGDELA